MINKYAATKDCSFSEDYHRMVAHKSIYHVAKSDGTAVCGYQLLNEPNMPLYQVPRHRRCRRNGCRQAYQGDSRG